MNIASTVLIALAMSTDAFAVAVCKGAALYKPRWREALRTGLIFGVIETLTPLLGWAVGNAAAQFVRAWDHWVAFVLLGGLGLRMIYAGFSKNDPEIAKPTKHAFWILVVTGFATSIDAFAIGIGLAFIEVDIWRTAAAIGIATFAMVTLGVMLGRVLGERVGKRAEILGGLTLIGIGIYTLASHLHR